MDPARQALTASEIEPYGLLYAAVEPDALLETALELARALKKVSPNAVAQAKTSIYISDDVNSRSARRAGLEALTSLIGGRDWQGGDGGIRREEEAALRYVLKGAGRR